jgi:hypothetical protein
MTMAERIQEGLNLVRRFVGTPYEAAAIAYLAAQVEIAKRAPHRAEQPSSLSSRRCGLRDQSSRSTAASGR